MSKTLDRLHRIAGQVAGLERMLKRAKSCPEVLTQILAARASLASLARELIKKECETASKKELDAIAKELFKID